MADARVLHAVALGIGPTESFIERQLVGRRFAPEMLSWGAVSGARAPQVPVRRVAIRCRPGSRLAWLERHAGLLLQLGKRRPSLVHAHFGNVGASLVPHCRALRLPLLVSFYGQDMGAGGQGALARRYEPLFRYASGFFAEGPAAMARLVGLGAPEARVILLPLSLPEGAERPPVRPPVADGAELRLLQIARFVEKKGIDRSLRALKLARSRGVEARLDIIGGGPLEGELRSLAAELGLHECVHFRGYVPLQELPSELAAAHVLLQPSRTAADGDTEGGHPTVIIEAQAAGLPVIASRHADIPFALEHGRAGLMCDEFAEPAALAALIEQAFRDRGLLRSLAAAGRAAALERHDPDKLLEIREAAYERASGRRVDDGR